MLCVGIGKSLELLYKGAQLIMTDIALEVLRPSCGGEQLLHNMLLYLSDWLCGVEGGESSHGVQSWAASVETQAFSEDSGNLSPMISINASY